MADLNTNVETNAEGAVDTKNENSGTETKPAIDFSKLDQTTKEAENAKNEAETVEGLKVALEKERLERAKLKASFDKKAREKAEAEKKAKAAEEKANEPIEEVVRLQRELEEIKISNMKTNLTFTLSKEWGVSDELTSKMVSSIFSDETGGFVEGDFRAAQLELIKSVREQAKKEGYDERDKEVMNGKPRSIGKSKTLDPFEQIKSKYDK